MVVATKTHFTRDEVADRWGISVRTVDEAIRVKTLDVVRFGRVVRVPVAEVERVDREGLSVK